MSSPNVSAPPAGLRPTRMRYGVLGFACSLSMITYLDRVCFGTVAPHLQSEFGLNDEEKGLLFTAFASPMRCSRCPAVGSATSSARAGR